MANPPSLGDDTSKKLRMAQEEIPLPATRAELLTIFENILKKGMVQKVVVEIGRPIKISRLVKDELPDPEPLPEEDLFINVRNAEMQEFVFTEQLPLPDYLFRAFHSMSQKRLRPKFFLVKSLDSLRKCLGVDVMWDLGELFGIEVAISEAVPEDVLLLAATKPGEEEIALSFRMLLTPPRRK